MTSVIGRQKPISQMCNGCARARASKCDVIIEPAYIFETRGTCFAKVDKARAQEIEDEINFTAAGGARRKGKGK